MLNIIITFSISAEPPWCAELMRLAGHNVHRACNACPPGQCSVRAAPYLTPGRAFTTGQARERGNQLTLQRRAVTAAVSAAGGAADGAGGPEGSDQRRLMAGPLKSWTGAEHRPSGCLRLPAAAALQPVGAGAPAVVTGVAAAGRVQGRQACLHQSQPWPSLLARHTGMSAAKQVANPRLHEQLVVTHWQQQIWLRTDGTGVGSAAEVWRRAIAWHSTGAETTAPIVSFK